MSGQRKEKEQNIGEKVKALTGLGEVTQSVPDELQNKLLELRDLLIYAWQHIGPGSMPYDIMHVEKTPLFLTIDDIEWIFTYQQLYMGNIMAHMW
ncbi:hypothetical protein L484_003190 [Morus notabilis]|uniref:Uncharacterized protein n=1 Tax=Morus notabilis TaxID=981085 RepID=W9QTZ4_9ROSA|nr:hypothetical protein L484_003190 [Morus notabilis]